MLVSRLSSGFASQIFLKFTKNFSGLLNAHENTYLKSKQSYIILSYFGKICYNGDTFPGSSMVEQEAVNFEVAGSSPVPGAIFVSQKHQKNGLGSTLRSDASPVLVFFYKLSVQVLMAEEGASWKKRWPSRHSPPLASSFSFKSLLPSSEE